MSITIKQLAAGALATNISAATDMTPIVPSGKAWIIKGMRFYNTHASASVALTVILSSVNAPATTPTYSPKVIDNVTIPPNASFIDNEELTLEHAAPASPFTGTRLQYKTGATGGTIDYVISGIERDA